MATKRVGPARFRLRPLLLLGSVVLVSLIFAPSTAVADGPELQVTVHPSGGLAGKSLVILVTVERPLTYHVGLTPIPWAAGEMDVTISHHCQSETCQIEHPTVSSQTPMRDLASRQEFLFLIPGTAVEVPRFDFLIEAHQVVYYFGVPAGLSGNGCLYGGVAGLFEDCSTELLGGTANGSIEVSSLPAAPGAA